jgi:hypothetical protein
VFSNDFREKARIRLDILAQ